MSTTAPDDMVEPKTNLGSMEQSVSPKSGVPFQDHDDEHLDSVSDKKLSFNPRVQTYDIPLPTVVLTHDDSEEEMYFDHDPEPTTPPAKESFTQESNSLRSQRPVSRQQSRSGDPKASSSQTLPNRPRSSQSPVSKLGPDWYEELSDGQISMFKQVFELLDHDGGGTINSEELYNSLKDLDIGIKREEIDFVLQELDNDGNGEIDFDEFLYAMSMTDKYIDQLTGGERSDDDLVTYSKRQRLFFTAITRFAIKNSLNDIERYYTNKARQAPHVIGFYTAGARLIGLNDKQLERELRRLQKKSKNQDSPYAKLPCITTRPKKQKRKKRTRKGSGKGTCTGCSESTEKDDTHSTELSVPSTMTVEESDMALQAHSAHPNSRERTIMPNSSEIGEIEKLLNELADEGSIVARLPGIHLVPAIRTKLDNGEKPMLCSSKRKKKKKKSSNRSQSARYGRDGGRQTRRGVPKMALRHFDMPTIQMSEKKRESLTIEDVPYIRQKVSEALGRYYGKLQKDHVKTACDDWDNLHVDAVQSGKSKENFRKVYGAYSPHKEEDVFVIAPWIPGPRYTSATVRQSTFAPTPRTHTQSAQGHYRESYSRASTQAGTRPSTVMA